MIFPYDERTAETREKIMDGRTTYIPNKIYKNETYGWYWYINTKGYYHIIKPCKVNYDGVFSHYEIEDFLITKSNTMKSVSCGGFYKTREACIEVIENTVK